MKNCPFGGPLSFFPFLPSFVMLFISCRWARSLGIIVSCTIDCMSLSKNRDYPPLCVCAFVCVHTHIEAGARLVFFFPLCSHTALLCFWFLLLLDSVFFIPEDNMKSSHDTYNAATRLLITGRKKKFWKYQQFSSACRGSSYCACWLYHHFCPVALTTYTY